ncbi:hypothetical protein KKI93_17735 [Xenorhabdus bovienii]|uniref:STY1053 family phage-associated protein n=1 Tax=Xenorhabdus bovienii TaxID=40576 RepID=UPI0023B26114|nr:hypothetical protein [Xenorhabdus bovienii]MDE9565848.1 hypothetical protein [Xenorhabdus bovienii]
MKYLVSNTAILNFVDGTQVELYPGIHSFTKEVVNHWAFAAHAQPIDENELKQKDSNAPSSLKAEIKKLTAENEGLKAQLEAKDATISALNNSLEEMKTKVKPNETDTKEKPEADNGKKQSSADS